MKVGGHYETDSRYPPPDAPSSVWQAPLISPGARMVSLLPGLQIPQEDHIFLDCQTSRSRSCRLSPRHASSRHPLPKAVRAQGPALACRPSKHMGVFSHDHRPRLAPYRCHHTRGGHKLRLSSSQGRLLLQARTRAGKGACPIKNYDRVSTALSYVLFQINSFYLQKEAEVKLRLETLLSKRRAAALRTLPDTDDLATDHVEWTAVEEGFRLLERDLARLLVREGRDRKTCMDVDFTPSPAIYRTQCHRVQENLEEMG